MPLQPASHVVAEPPPAKDKKIKKLQTVEPKQPTLAACTTESPMRPPPAPPLQDTPVSHTHEAVQPDTAEQALQRQTPALDDLAWWFEVSAHSSRVHLHTAADGTQPMGLNVPLEALLDGGGGLTDSVVDALTRRCVDHRC